jgi:hypothetical protein
MKISSFIALALSVIGFLVMPNSAISQKDSIFQPGYDPAAHGWKPVDQNQYDVVGNNTVSISQLPKISVPQEVPQDVALLNMTPQGYLWVAMRRFSFNDELLSLRWKAAGELEAISNLNIMVYANLTVLFAGICLKRPIEAPYDADKIAHELEFLTKEYAKTMKQIEAITGDKEKAERKYNEQMKRLNELIKNELLSKECKYCFDLNINDSTVVNRYYPSDASDVPGAPSNLHIIKSLQKNTHIEYSYDIYKVKVKFKDKEGKPCVKEVFDVLRKSKEVPNQK